MNARLADAIAKFEKAEEFFLLGEVAEQGQWDAAVSLAVSSGINAADVLRLLREGVFGTTKAHQGAVTALRRIGYGSEANALLRLLSVKNKAQYSVRRATAVEAADALKRANRLLQAARAEIEKMEEIDD